MSDDLIARVVDVLIMSPMSEHVHEFEHVGHTADALMPLIREVQSDEARDHQTAAEDERDALAARLATVEAERGDLIDRLTVAKALHTPQPGQGPAYCQSCDERWPCPTRAALAAAPINTTKEADR